MRSLLLLLIIGFLGFNATGQMSTTLDTVYVQASRIPMKANTTGRNISVITSDQIKNTYATSIDDLLQYIPGIEVQTRNAFGAQGDITMRGSTFTQVLVLIDGMKLNDPLTSHFNSNIPVSPAEIERIEVLRGAAAAMYGADAVGGVINIITKGSMSMGSDEISAEFNLGQNNLVNAQQGFSLKKGNSYFGGGFSINKSDGEYIPARTVNGTDLEGYNNFFDNKSIGVSFGHKWDNGWNMKFRSAYDDRDFSARYFYTTSTFDKSTEITRNWWNQLQVTKVGQNSSTDFNIAYKYNTDEFVFSPDFSSTNNHVSKYLNFNIGHLRSLSDDITLRIGAQLDRRSVVSSDRGDHADTHAGVYAMSNLQLTDKLNATASLRLDYDENYDVEFTPQLNASYQLKSAVIRASIGRSIRAADYTERYVSFNLTELTPGRSLGNPDLIAESSWSEEIGVDVDITKHWKLKATGFFRQSSNLIDYVSTNEAEIPNNQGLQVGENYFYARNITDVNTKGIEIESWLSYPLSKSTNLQWIAGYTNLSTTNDEGTISVYISSHARHLLTNQLVLTSSLFDISLTNLHKTRGPRVASAIDANLEDSYSLWNSRLKIHLTDQLSGQVQLHNMFDIEYSDILGAPLPGRWFSGGISVRL